jgi:uncharacterized protein YjaZ
LQLSKQQQTELFENVRFPYLNYQQLERVVQDKLVSEDLLAEAIMHRLGKQKRLSFILFVVE